VRKHERPRYPVLQFSPSSVPRVAVLAVPQVLTPALTTDVNKSVPPRYPVLQFSPSSVPRVTVLAVPQVLTPVRAPGYSLALLLLLRLAVRGLVDGVGEHAALVVRHELLHLAPRPAVQPHRPQHRRHDVQQRGLGGLEDVHDHDGGDEAAGVAPERALEVAQVPPGPAQVVAEDLRKQSGRRMLMGLHRVGSFTSWRYPVLQFSLADGTPCYSSH
jgi:hypothetical protein